MNKIKPGFRVWMNLIRQSAKDLPISLLEFFLATFVVLFFFGIGKIAEIWGIMETGFFAVFVLAICTFKASLRQTRTHNENVRPSKK